MAGVSKKVIRKIESSQFDPRFSEVQRILHSMGQRLILLSDYRSPISSWASFIADALRDDNRGEQVGFRALIGINDELVSAPPTIRIALCVNVPAPTGDIRFDAAIAAMVEHHLAAFALPVPDWVFEPSRFVSDPWIITPFTDEAEVPGAFHRHGVYLAASELASI